MPPGAAGEERARRKVSPAKVVHEMRTGEAMAAASRRCAAARPSCRRREEVRANVRDAVAVV